MNHTIPTKEAMLQSLASRHGADLQRRLTQASVAVCGLGGLGSHIAVALARAGIGKLYLIDFDKVDLSNLNRQQYFVSQIGQDKSMALRDNLAAIAPYTEVIPYPLRLTEQNLKALLQDADIICEAFDQPEEKAMLVNGVLEQLPDKYLVSASGMAGLGSGNLIHTRKITKHFYLCGDEVSDVSQDIGLISSRVMICAGHQAHMVLRILAEEYAP